jgi:hypothetical protein
MTNIGYALSHLKLRVIGQVDWRSKFADSILDFWMLPGDCRMIVHAYVFKDMDIAALVERLAKRPPSQSQSDASVKL